MTPYLALLLGVLATMKRRITKKRYILFSTMMDGELENNS